MHINIEKVLKGLLIFGGLYLLFESFLFLSGIRLTDVKNVWPSSAIAYSTLLEKLLGIAFLFIAVILLEISKNLSGNKIFIKLSAMGSLFMGVLVLFLALSNNYLGVFKSSPSLYVWFPPYNQYLILEGIILIFYSVLVYLWIKQKRGK